jgi:hypothetical protein
MAARSRSCGSSSARAAGPRAFEASSESCLRNDLWCADYKGKSFSATGAGVIPQLSPTTPHALCCWPERWEQSANTLPSAFDSVCRARAADCHPLRQRRAYGSTGWHDRFAPRHEIAGVEAGTGLRRYGDLSVGSILGVVDAVARATRFAGSMPCALRGNGAAGVLRDEVMRF